MTIEDSPDYEKPPRPIAGWTVFTLGLLVRAWALPFAFAGWIVGTIVLASSFGFALSWDGSDFALARRIREGRQIPNRKNAKKRPELYDEHDNFFDDDDDDV